MLPRLTVIIPVWDDYARFLPACVESIRRQGVAARVIVVDNASLAPIAAPAGCQLLRLHERMSVGATRNAALALVATPYVAFADVDDEVLDGTYRTALDRMDADLSLAACATSVVNLDHDTGDRAPATTRPIALRLAGHRRLFALYMLLRCGVPVATGTVFHTTVVKDCGGFADANHAEDWALAAKVAWRGRVELHPHPGRLYRQRDGSLFNRDLDRETYAEGMAVVRAALLGDGAVPSVVKRLMPAVRRFHELKADRTLAGADTYHALRPRSR